MLLVAATAVAAPGDLDPTFGVGGKATSGFPGFGSPRSRSLVVDSSDRTLVVGFPTSSAGQSHISVARFDTTGLLDPTYGSSGRTTSTLAEYPAVVGGGAAALQADGKLVVAGRIMRGADPTVTDFAVVRFNTDGSIDTGFGVNGLARTSIGDTGGARVVVIQSDQRIVALGGSESGSQESTVLVRYESSGTLDATFSGDGVATFLEPTGQGSNQIALQPDGKLVLAGFSSQSGSQDFFLRRVDASGALDAAFGTSGIVTSDFAGDSEDARAVAVQADGRIVVAGRSYTGLASSYDFVVARYDTSGVLDSTFSGDGWATTAILDQDEANSIVLQPDGRIVVAGQASENIAERTFYYLAVIRYEADGSLDAAFGDGGIVTTQFDTADGTDVALQSDGKIVATGETAERGFIAIRYQVESCLPDCGNGVLDACESCDDSNVIDGDGCDSNCTRTGCGNAVVSADEDCDDADGTNGDGCDATCRTTGCGSGAVTPGEVCDDGNLDDGDGCDRNCTYTACGNSVAAGDETCDDGNAVPADGCEPDCTLTPVSQMLPAGGTATTDTGTGPTDSFPIQLELTTPNAGPVTITAVVPEESPSGYSLLGIALEIDAPPATAADPLILEFSLDATAIPDGVSLSSIAVLRDGVAMADCSGAPGVASPDPCVSSRADIGAGDVAIVVLTSHASLWSMALGVPDKADGNCLNKMNGAGLAVASAQLKLNKYCVAATQEGEVSDTDACVLADDGGKVLSRKEKTIDVEAGECASAPPFGMVGAAAMNSAAQDEAIDLVLRLFGSDLSAAVVSSSSVADASCQEKLLSAAQTLFLKTAKAYAKCVKKGLAGKAEPIVAPDGLSACLAATSAGLEKGKAKLLTAVEKSCATSDLETLFPGPWSLNCAEQRIESCLPSTVLCRACRMLRSMNGSDHDCDLFDDHSLDDSCAY